MRLGHPRSASGRRTPGLASVPGTRRENARIWQAGLVLASQPAVWIVAFALPVVLLSSWLLGTIARWLLRRRVRLGAAASIGMAMLGTSAGLFLSPGGSSPSPCCGAPSRWR